MEELQELSENEEAPAHPRWLLVVLLLLHALMPLIVFVSPRANGWFVAGIIGGGLAANNFLCNIECWIRGRPMILNLVALSFLICAISFFSPKIIQKVLMVILIVALVLAAVFGRTTRECSELS